MTALEELQIVRKRALKLAKDVEIAAENARRELMNQRLDRSEVAMLLGYKYKSMTNLDIPFNDRGYIYYNDLLDWTDRNKPARLSRLKSNFKQFNQETL